MRDRIFVITSTSRITYGHGDSMDEQMLARLGAYGSDGYCPAFPTRESAVEWLKNNGKFKNWQITELIISNL